MIFKFIDFVHRLLCWMDNVISYPIKKGNYVIVPNNISLMNSVNFEKRINKINNKLKFIQEKN